MRNTTPQIETAEITDAELDNVSGGVHAGLASGVEAGLDGVSGHLNGGVAGVGGVNGNVSGGLAGGGLPAVGDVTGLVG